MAAEQVFLKKQEVKQNDDKDVLQVPLIADLLGEGVPTCGGDLNSPVVDTVRFAREQSYVIGGRRYIENADGGGMPEA